MGDDVDFAERLLERSKIAWEKKTQFDNLYRDAYKYGMPQRNGYDEPTPGSPRMDEVFDSTAITATTAFATRLQTEFTPMFQRFASFEAGPLVPKRERTKLNKILGSVSERAFAILDISNFHSAVGEFYLDLAAGTGVMFVEETKGKQHASPVRFTTVPAYQVAIEEGPDGAAEGVFYKWKLPLRNVKRTWPDARPSTDLADRIKDKPDAEETFLCATVFDEDKGVFLYDVIDEKAKESILRRPRRYMENPWIVCRWMKAANEVNGRGPLVQALPDIRTLNKLIELILKNASLSVSGVYTATDDGILNPGVVRIVPGAVIPVMRNPGHPSGASLVPLPRAADFNVASLERDDLRAQIKRTLFDVGLPPDTGPVRSPTEIVARMKDLASNIGGAFGRLMSEFIQPLFRRLLGIMQRSGLLNDVGAVKLTGYLVQIKVTSPLARLQNASDIEAVLNWLQALAVLGPELVAISAKVEDIGEWLGTKFGAPAELIRDPEERKAHMAETQRMNAEAQAAAQVKMDVATGTGGVTQAPEAQVA